MMKMAMMIKIDRSIFFLILFAYLPINNEPARLLRYHNVYFILSIMYTKYKLNLAISV